MSVYSPAWINSSFSITAAIMQIIVIALLIVIAGLIGALLACATSLISRVRATNTTLRRIEETLLAMNRVKAIDSAIKSAGPAQQPQSADAGSADFLTLRELKTMSGRGRPSTNSAPILNGRKPPRTSAPPRPATGLHGALGREGTLAVRNAEVATHGAAVAALKSEDTWRTNAELAKHDPSIEAAEVTATREMLEASENPNGPDSSFEISWPKPNQQIRKLDLRMGADDGIVPWSQKVVTAIANMVSAANGANGELPIQKASEAVEETPVAISPAILETFPEASTPNCDTLRESPEATTVGSAVGRRSPEPGRGGQTEPTSNALDESRRKKKEQETLMIISSRRRRARAGR